MLNEEYGIRARGPACSACRIQHSAFSIPYGLTTIDVVPHIKSGHPGSEVWQWLSDYYLNILDRYALAGDVADHIHRAWRAAERDPASLLIAT